MSALTVAVLERFASVGCMVIVGFVAPPTSVPCTVVPSGSVIVLFVVPSALVVCPICTVVPSGSVIVLFVEPSALVACPSILPSGFVIVLFVGIPPVPWVPPVNPVVFVSLGAVPWVPSVFVKLLFVAPASVPFPSGEGGFAPP